MIAHRKTFIIVGTVVAVLALLMLATPLLFNAEYLRPMLESRLTAALGRHVTVGHLRFSWLAGGIRAEDIAIADDPGFSSRPFLTSKSLDVNLEIMPLLLHREVHVNSLTVRQPQATLIRQGERWNFSSLGPKTSPTPAAPAAATAPAIELKRLSIAEGEITVVQPGDTQKYSDVNFTARDFTPQKAFPFTLSARLAGEGKLKIEGSAGPMPANTAETPVEATIALEKVPVASYAGAGSGLAGSLGMQSKFRSDGRRATVEGTAQVSQLVLAKGGAPLRTPVDMKFAAAYNLKTHIADLTRADMQVAKSVAHLRGQVDLRGRPLLNLALSAADVQATDLQELLQAAAVSLPGGASLSGGGASTALTLTGPANAAVIAGPVKVQGLTIRGFNFGSKLRTAAVMTGIQTGADTTIQSLQSNLRIAPEGMRMDAINAVVDGAGTLDGSGTVDANNHLDFALTAHLSQGGGLLGGLLQAAKVGQLSTVPFKIQGTTSDPKFIPDVNSILQTPSQGDAQTPAQKRQQKIGGFLQQYLGGKK